MGTEAIIKNLNMDSLFLLNCNRLASNDVTLASRVNHAICVEAEAGRAHGETFIDKNCLIAGRSQIRIHLNLAYQLGLGCIYPGFPFDYFSGGEPLIEIQSSIGPWIPSTKVGNGIYPWNTQNIYLRALTLSKLQPGQNDCLGFNPIEYQQANVLGGNWGFSGDWGDKNRINDVNWHEDDSLLTTQGDRNSANFLVCDARNIPQYVIELLSTPIGNLLLAVRYLKRKDFPGPRRVFFPPEDDIEIWGAFQIAQPHITDVILCFDPGMMFQNYPNHVAVGCIPGGVNAIGKSNFAPLLHGKRVWLILLNHFDQEEVSFVLTCAAMLRKNQIPFNCIELIGSWSFGEQIVIQNKLFPVTRKTCGHIQELSLPELCNLAKPHNIFTPEELRSDYLGDITATVNAHEAVPVITGLFNSDDIVLLDTHDEPIVLMLIARFARALNSGTAIFPGLWENGHFASVVFVDHPTDMVAGYLRDSGVRICDSRFINASQEEWLNVFQTVAGTAQVVFFTGYEVWAKPTVFLDAIRWCRRNRKAVVILPMGDDSALLKKVRHMTSKFISVNRIDGEAEITTSITANGITSVAAAFNHQGIFLSAKALAHSQEEQVVPVQAIPSTPYNNHRLEGLASLPPEKKLTAIAERNNHEINLLK